MTHPPTADPRGSGRLIRSAAAGAVLALTAVLPDCVDPLYATPVMRARCVRGSAPRLGGPRLSARSVSVGRSARLRWRCPSHRPDLCGRLLDQARLPRHGAVAPRRPGPGGPGRGRRHPGNRWDIALRTYCRHQVPAASDGYFGFDQFRLADGTPRYPQRRLLVGPLVFGSVSGGAAYDGHINGKMIVVDNLYDVDALPWHADWYAKRVKAALGDRAFRNNYRLYYNDHADHLEGPVTGTKANRVVSYDPIVEQALRDLAAWAERGVTPPRSTNYRVVDAQVIVPRKAAQRRGIQPVVDLTVRGGDRITVKAGQRVRFSAKAQVPPGTGKIVSAGWDFTGTGSYTPTAIVRPKPTVKLDGSHRYTEPGTYYVSVKVASSRSGRAEPFAQVENLDRVRVVVRP